MQATMSYRPVASPLPRLAAIVRYAGQALILGAMGLLAIAFYLSEEYAPFTFVVPVSVAAVASIVLAQRFQRWGHIPGVIVGVVVIALALPHFIESSETPDSFFDFVPGVFGVTGGVLALLTSVPALARKDVSSIQVPAAIAAVALVTVVAGFSGIATIAARESVSAADRAGATEVTLKGIDFAQEQYVVQGGTAMKIVVDNDDPVIHTFTVKELDIDVEVTPGSSKLVEFVAPAAGTYEIICEISGHSSMKSELVVR